MKKTNLLISATFLLSTFFINPVYAKNNFKDLDESNKAFESVQEIVNKYKIMSGVSKTEFNGNEYINRYAYSVVIFNTIELLNNKMEEIAQQRLLETEVNITKKQLELFKIPDLSKNHWSYEKVMKALSLDLIKTYKDNSFKGTKNVSYIGFTIGIGRVMKIIYQKAPPVLKRKWDKEKAISIKKLNFIPKASPVYEPLKLALENNLVDYDKNILKKNINRYEVAIFLTRLINKMEELRKYIIFSKIG